MSEPAITLMLLSYNQARFLPDAIAGALAQDFGNLEILISDDNSTDASPQIIRDAVAAYRGPHRIVTNFNPTNLGLVPHFNKAMRLARAPFVLVAASDDISLPHRASHIARTLAESEGPVLAVVSDIMGIDEAGREIGYISNFAPAGKLTAQGFARDGSYVNGAAAGYARELIETFGDLDPRAWAEDSIMPFRAALLGSVVHIPEALVRRRIHDASMTGNAPADREKLLRTMRPMQFAFAVRLQDIDHPIVQARLGASMRQELRERVLATIDRDQRVIELIERRPGSVLGLLRAALRGSLSLGSAFRALLIFRCGYLWYRYVALSLWVRRMLGRQR